MPVTEGAPADTELLIVGHTDATGSDAYNQELSERRAQAALRYLAAQSVSADRMHASGRGEWEPAGDERDGSRASDEPPDRGGELRGRSSRSGS